MLVDDLWQDQPDEKGGALLVDCFDIGQIAQQVCCMISKLPPLAVRQVWRPGIPHGACFGLKDGHQTLRIENDVTGCA